MKQRTNQFAWKSANPSPATFCPSAKVPKGEGACNGTSNQPASESKTTTSDEPAKKKVVKYYTGEVKKAVFTGRSRTAFARKVYGELPEKEACKQVVRDVFGDTDLRHAMQATGWTPGERGYTDKQINLLTKFYQQKH